MQSEKTITTVILSGFLLLATASILNSYRKKRQVGAIDFDQEIEKYRIDVTEDQFHVMKVSQPPAFDVVAAGNSRVEADVAPQVLQRRLAGLRIFNYGFSAAVWTGEYLDAARALLDPHSPRKIMILATSPIAVTTVDIYSNTFTKFYRMSERRRFEILKTDDVFQPFNPVRTRDNPERYFRQDFYSNGWLGAMWKPTRFPFEYFRKKAPGQRLATEVIDGMMARVSRWTKEGVHVYGYWNPTSQEMWELEDSLTRLDRGEFEKRFTDAGGVWLHFDNSRYSWKDGHHMDKDVALRFSDDLGRAIAAHEKPTATQIARR